MLSRVSQQTSSYIAYKEPDLSKRFQGITSQSMPEIRKTEREKESHQKLKEIRSALESAKVKFEDYLMQQGIRKAHLTQKYSNLREELQDEFEQELTKRKANDANQLSTLANKLKSSWDVKDQIEEQFKRAEATDERDLSKIRKVFRFD